MVQGELTSVDTSANSLTFKSGGSDQVLKYDYLIIATGSTLNEFKDNKAADIKKSIENVSGKLGKSSNIAILGAGSVGLELAGEIRDNSPNANITVIGKNILSNPKGLPDSIRDDIKKQMKEYKINHVPHNAQGEFKKGNWDERIQFDAEVEVNNTKTI